MKKGTLNIGNREFVAAAKIEDTHAVVVEEQPKEKKSYKQVGFRKKKVQKETYVKAIRFNEEEFVKLDKYLEMNNLGFSELVKELFEEKGIL